MQNYKLGLHRYWCTWPLREFMMKCSMSCNPEYVAALLHMVSGIYTRMIYNPLQEHAANKAPHPSRKRGSRDGCTRIYYSGTDDLIWYNGNRP